MWWIIGVYVVGWFATSIALIEIECAQDGVEMVFLSVMGLLWPFYAIPIAIYKLYEAIRYR